MFFYLSNQSRGIRLDSMFTNGIDSAASGDKPETCVFVLYWKFGVISTSSV